ncbi:hypothetical protein Tco_0033320 [Tanacetum coccineum]
MLLGCRIHNALADLIPEDALKRCPKVRKFTSTVTQNPLLLGEQQGIYLGKTLNLSVSRNYVILRNNSREPFHKLDKERCRNVKRHFVMNHLDVPIGNNSRNPENINAELPKFSFEKNRDVKISNFLWLGSNFNRPKPSSVSDFYASIFLDEMDMFLNSFLVEMCCGNDSCFKADFDFQVGSNRLRIMLLIDKLSNRASLQVYPDHDSSKLQPSIVHGPKQYSDGDMWNKLGYG